MPALPASGLLVAKRITTGRLYWRPTPSPSNAEYDLGNVMKWKRNDRTDTVEHIASRNGVRIVDATYVHTLGFGYVFTLDEYVPLVLQLLQKTNAAAFVPTASASPGATVTLVDVIPGRSYPIGPAVGVTVTAVKVAAADKTGWSFNRATGRLTILEDGDIAADDDVIVTYGAVGASFSRHTSALQPVRNGVFVFIETDQHSLVPRARHEWSGSMWVNGDAEQTAEVFGTIELNCSCHTPPVVDERQN